MKSMPIVRALCWRRARRLGAIPGGARHPQGRVAEMLPLGGGRLAEDPGRWCMAGAPCQPWQAERDFYGITPRIGMSHPLALDQLHLLLKDGDVAALCKQNGLHACPLPVHGRRHGPHCPPPRCSFHHSPGLVNLTTDLLQTAGASPHFSRGSQRGDRNRGAELSRNDDGCIFALLSICGRTFAVGFGTTTCGCQRAMAL
jgi:hypothetical protein